MTTSPPEIPLVDLASSQEDNNHILDTDVRKRKEPECDYSVEHMNTYSDKRKRISNDGIPSTSGLQVRCEEVIHPARELNATSNFKNQPTQQSFMKLKETIMRMEKAMENAGLMAISLTTAEDRSDSQSGAERFNDRSVNIIQKSEFDAVVLRVKYLEDRMTVGEEKILRIERNCETYNTIMSKLKTIFCDTAEEISVADRCQQRNTGSDNLVQDKNTVPPINNGAISVVQQSARPSKVKRKETGQDDNGKVPTHLEQNEGTTTPAKTTQNIFTLEQTHHFTPRKVLENYAGKQCHQPSGRTDVQGTKKQTGQSLKIGATVLVPRQHLAVENNELSEERRNKSTEGENKIPNSTPSALNKQAQIEGAISSGSSMQHNFTHEQQRHTNTNMETNLSTPKKVSESNTGTKSHQYTSVRNNSQGTRMPLDLSNSDCNVPNETVPVRNVPGMSESSPTLTNDVEVLEIPMPQNIPIKQEFMSDLPSMSMPHLKADSSGRINIFVWGTGRKIRGVAEFKADYGVHFIHNRKTFQYSYISDLKTKFVKRQAEVLAALHAVKELKASSDDRSKIHALIILKDSPLVNMMSRHRSYFLLPAASVSPCAVTSADYWRGRKYSASFPEDMAQLVTTIMGLDITWVNADQLRSPEKELLNHYRKVAGPIQRQTRPVTTTFPAAGPLPRYRGPWMSKLGSRWLKRKPSKQTGTSIAVPSPGPHRLGGAAQSPASFVLPTPNPHGLGTSAQNL